MRQVGAVANAPASIAGTSIETHARGAAIPPPFPTGPTGHIVKLLLARGYRVHGTCRDPGNAQACSHLRALPGAAERLRLFQADLLQPGSFHPAMQGCRYVIHTASPYTLTVRRGQVRLRSCAVLSLWLAAAAMAAADRTAPHSLRPPLPDRTGPPPFSQSIKHRRRRR